MKISLQRWYIDRRQVRDMLRKVELPGGFPGELYLTRMPGSFNNINQDFENMKAVRINLIVCLTDYDEIKDKSALYLKAIKEQNVPFPLLSYPIRDFEAPELWQEFFDFITRTAAEIKSGKRVVIHCGAGIGRTGMVAICVLVQLGWTKGEAEKLIKHAGSNPESPVQRAFIDQFVSHLERS